jgi:histidyl-tRNA synthetase
MGPVFRYGRPQKGRYRQFSQVNCELIGSAAPGADVEVISLFVDLYQAWGFRDLRVKVNTVGQPASRREYGARLRQVLEPFAARLSEDSKRRLEQNPLRVLDTKDDSDLAVLRELGDKLPRMLDVVDAEDRAHWDQVIAGLDSAGIAYELDHGLVRGLDYYTRTAFEVHDPSLGAQSALGGGGRYDGLIEQLGGNPTPGVGFAIGMDRALLVIEERGLALAAPDTVYVVAREGMRAGVVALVRELRRTFRVECDVEGRSFKNQMEAAGKAKARFVVIAGEEEWARGEVALKDSKAGEQVAVARSALASELASRRDR